MRRLFFILFIYLCFNSAFNPSQAFAIPREPGEFYISQEPDQLRLAKEDGGIDMFFIDKQTGWLSSDTGLVGITRDGGDSWFTGQTPVNGHLFFLNDRIGWGISARTGVLWKTTDGGLTWSVGVDQDSPRPDRRVFFFDEQHGWGIGIRGILYTRDGGKTWEVVYKENSLDDLFFIGKKTGWVVGEILSPIKEERGKGLILLTKDGGQNWIVQAKRPEGGLKMVKFFDHSHGWAVGWRSLIVRTTDGGKTWLQQISPVSDVMFSSLLIGSRDEAWIGGDKGVLLHTTDGGKTWENVGERLQVAPFQNQSLKGKDRFMAIWETERRGMHNLTILGLSGTIYELRLK